MKERTHAEPLIKLFSFSSLIQWVWCIAREHFQTKLMICDILTKAGAIIEIENNILSTKW